MTPRTQIPIELARQLLRYEPESGDLRWRSTGLIAGSVDIYGYRKILLGDKQLMAHRIAWAMHYGEQPPAELDHINRVGSDNRIDNLRAVTAYQNCANTRARKAGSGYKGVHHRPHLRGKQWQARITVRGSRYSLGHFETAEEAGLVYEVAAERFFGVFALNGG